MFAYRASGEIHADARCIGARALKLEAAASRRTWRQAANNHQPDVQDRFSTLGDAGICHPLKRQCVVDVLRQ
jgi:hypothetical protein